MSPNALNIVNDVNLYIRNYAVDGFANLRLNSILLRLINLADVAGGGSPATSSQAQTIPITSADFTNATDVPKTILNGLQYSIYWNEGQRYILQDAGEWSYLSGGGFKVTMAGFDPTTTNYHFFLEISTASNGSTLPIISINFSNATDCPLPAFVNKNLAIFWNEAKRFILKDAGEWADLPGGGFKVLIAGFDSTTTNYHFYVQIL